MRGFLCSILTVLAMSASSQVVDRGGVKDVNGVVDNTPDSIAKAMTARPVPGSSRRGNNPVLFLIGNSTMRTGTLGNGNNGQWGWGYYAHEYFDPARITVENQALGGMSSRTFYNKLWNPIRQAIRPGDWVIISIGHNDNGPYDSGRARASIPGTGLAVIAFAILSGVLSTTPFTSFTPPRSVTCDDADMAIAVKTLHRKPLII